MRDLEGAGPRKARRRLLAALPVLVLGFGCDSRRREDIRVWLDLGQAPAAARATGERAGSRPEPKTARSAGSSVTAEKGAYRIVLHNVQVCPEPDTAVKDLSREIWGVEVELEALTVDDLPVNPFYARLVDSSGNAYRSIATGCEPRLGASPLARGQRASGWLDFRIPRARSGFTLVYAPRIGASTKATEVQLRLGR
jgi:hypothetical protein